MNTARDRYDRSLLLFGAEGQAKLAEVRATVVGVSGLGSPLVQHLALLGIGDLTLVEPEELDDTNRNRFVGARVSDPVPGSPKVDLAARLVAEINPDVKVHRLRCSLVTSQAFAAIRASDWVFGCLDHDGPRYVLNELSAACKNKYIDLASDVPEPGVYGGHVCVSGFSGGCLSCRGLLDMKAVNRWLASPEARAAHDAIWHRSNSTRRIEGAVCVAPEWNHRFARRIRIYGRSDGPSRAETCAQFPWSPRQADGCRQRRAPTIL